MLLSQNLWYCLVDAYRCYHHRICVIGWYMYMLRYLFGATITESVAMVGQCWKLVAPKYYSLNSNVIVTYGYDCENGVEWMNV